MRGNGSSWVVQPISCSPWQSAGWFDQSAGSDQLVQPITVGVSPPHPLSSTAPKHGKIQLSKFKVLFAQLYHKWMNIFFDKSESYLDLTLYHLFHFYANFALLTRRQNARFHSA